jgi:O-antigen/teichoic acid export membrane protein
MLEDALPGEAAANAAVLPDVIQQPAARRLSVMYLAGVLAGGNLLGNALRMAGGLLQNRYVKPEVLGTFNGIGLVLGFARFLQLGVLNGLNRELPYYFGQNDQKRVRELAAAAQAWAMALGVVVGIPFLGVAVWLALHGDFPMAAGWLAYGLLGFVFFYATMYLPSTYRTAHDFARLSTVNVVQNAVALVCVLAVVCCGFYGLCLRATIPVLIGLWILRRWQPIRVGPVWSFRHLRHLLVVGLPIFAVGELGGPLWVLIDQKLVQHFLDARGLGLYSMVLVAGGTMDLLPQAFSQVIYPRMSEHYGRTHNLAEIMLMAVRPSIMLVAGMLAVVVLGWWLARPLTAILLPNYLEAVPAMQWSLLGSVAISSCLVFNVYNVARRQDLYGIVQVASIGSYFLTLMWLIRNGADLAAFPKAMLVGKIVFAVAGLALLIPVYVQHAKA